MTLEDVAARVSRLKSLRIEQHKIELKIEELKARSERITPVLSGMPHSGGEVDKIGLYVGLISDQKEKLKKVNAALSVENMEVDKFFDIIEDDMIRIALEYKYIDGYPWSKVARTFGGNTPDSIRKACERYLAKI